MKRTNGIGEKAILLIGALLSGLWLWWKFGADHAYGLTITTGSSVQKLAILSAWVAVFLFGVGGVTFNAIEEYKRAHPDAFSRIVAGIVIAAGLCMVN